MTVSNPIDSWRTPVSCRRLASLASASLSWLMIRVVDALRAYFSILIVLTGLYAYILWPVLCPGRCALASLLCHLGSPW
eukprot:6212396-Pleurochrysis_carterae.AAC.3